MPPSQHNSLRKDRTTSPARKLYPVIGFSMHTMTKLFKWSKCSLSAVVTMTQVFVGMAGDLDLCQMVRGLLSNRRFFVQLNDKTSASRWRSQQFGLPQGSVLDPLLFNYVPTINLFLRTAAGSYMLMTSVSPHNRVIFNMLNIHWSWLLMRCPSTTRVTT